MDNPDNAAGIGGMVAGSDTNGHERIVGIGHLVGRTIVHSFEDYLLSGAEQPWGRLRWIEGVGSGTDAWTGGMGRTDFLYIWTRLVFDAVGGRRGDESRCCCKAVGGP